MEPATWTVLVVVGLAVFSGVTSPPGGSTAGSSTGVFQRSTGGPPGAFAFVSTFGDGRLDGWQIDSGAAFVSRFFSDGGEPVLVSWPSVHAPQVDRTSRGFVRGDSLVSFQAEIRASSRAAAYVGLTNSGVFVAAVGVKNGDIWAGTSPALATDFGPIPAGTAQEAGWVYLLVNVGREATAHGTPWRMAVFADRTDQVLASRLPVPGAANYTGGEVATYGGPAEYTDLIFSSYQLAWKLPEPTFNPMDGYGQGLGSWVTLLPDFTTISATLVLENWSVPEGDVLSFQINAMNLTGTEGTGPSGFFQVGVNLNPNGTIAPWYVWRNYNPHYFGHTGPQGAWPGFHSADGTPVTVSITDDSANQTLDFRLTDLAVHGANRSFFASVGYSGEPFTATFTQVEFEPDSAYPVADYFFNGSMNDIRISGGNLTAPEPLGAAYMLPIVLDAPPSWNLHCYQDAASGYHQQA